MKHKGTYLLTIGLILLVTTGIVFAMESPNYILDWFTPLDSNGGGFTMSSHNSLNFTIGQISGFTPEICLGYWCGPFQPGGTLIFLPLAHNSVR
jgi:hypothetical protein